MANAGYRGAGTAKLAAEPRLHNSICCIHVRQELAFDELALARIVATTEHDNLRSIAVMRRLGMTIERNPLPEPHWFQTVGVLVNPGP